MQPLIVSAEVVGSNPVPDHCFGGSTMKLVGCHRFVRGGAQIEEAWR